MSWRTGLDWTPGIHRNLELARPSCKTSVVLCRWGTEVAFDVHQLTGGKWRLNEFHGFGPVIYGDLMGFYRNLMVINGDLPFWCLNMLILVLKPGFGFASLATCAVSVVLCGFSRVYIVFWRHQAASHFTNFTVWVAPLSQIVSRGFGVGTSHHPVLGIQSENPMAKSVKFRSLHGTISPHDVRTELGTGSPCLASLLGHSTAAAGDFGTAGTDPWRWGAHRGAHWEEIKHWRWGFCKLNLRRNRENYWSGFGPHIYFSMAST